MSSITQDCCFIGRGKIYVKPYLATGTETNSFEFIGNASSFEFVPNVNELTVKNYTTTAGGTECSFEEIESVDVNMTVTCANVANLARAFLGTQATVATSAITNEAHFVEGVGAFIPLKNMPAAAPAIVVTDVAGTTTYLAGTDYILDGSVLCIPTGSTITAASTIHVDYTKKAQDVVEILTKTSGELEVLFDGINAASGASYRVNLFKVKFGPADGFSFIGDDIVTFTLSGTALPASKTNSVSGLTSGFSQYGTIQVA
jgi:hypothetical protein